MLFSRFLQTHLHPKSNQRIIAPCFNSIQIKPDNFRTVEVRQGSSAGFGSTSESFVVSPPPSILLLKEAYETLYTPSLREKYDRDRQSESQVQHRGPRPAQVVSLDEFDLVDEVDGGVDTWQYPCRCSGYYRIKSTDMEVGHHLVGFSSCSEVVWVGYELVEAG